MTDAELLRRISDYYASGGGGDVDVQKVGSLVVALHRTSDAWYMSYATPRPEGLAGADWGRDLAAALKVFEKAGRAPSVEWINELAPGLDTAAIAAGLPAPDAEPLLVVTPDALVVPTVEGATGRLVTVDDDIRSLRLVAHEVFGELGPLQLGEVERVRGDIASGRRIEAAVFVDPTRPAPEATDPARPAPEATDGEAVSVGDHTPAEGVTEITGIATRAPYRRRGFGGLVTALLAQQAFAAGCEVVYLTAASNEAARVYERVGFRRIATARTTARRGAVLG